LKRELHIKKQLRLFIAEDKDFSPVVLQKLQQHFKVTIRKCGVSEVEKILEEYDIFWFRLGFKINEHVLKPGIRCKYIVTPVTGIDHIDEAMCDALGIKIICLRGEEEFLRNVRATAEHTLLLTLLVMRQAFAAYTSVVKNKIWNRDLFRGIEIFEKTVGIVGVGRLGRITASLFEAFGARVIGFDHRKDFPAGVERVHSLTELAKRSDIVSIHLTYNSQTKHLINANFFLHMKPDSYFINTARGGIVNEQDLLNALRYNKIKGAAFDVISNEYEPLWKNSLVQYAEENTNLILTPHIGGNTFESFEKTENFLANKLMNLSYSNN